MQLTEVNQEVFYAQEDLTCVSAEDIAFLKKKALANDRKRIRLCSHKDVQDTLHEMLIIHMKGAYVRPHKHLNKSESLHVVEGMAEVVIFDEEGAVTDVIPVGEYSSGRKFYYRVSAPRYHTLIVHSDFFVFHETTKGPFQKSDTVFAPWAPQETDREACRAYMDKLAESLARHLSAGAGAGAGGKS